MRRAMVGFEQDEAGDWVALLECGHRQHVRHRPPWQERAWVLTSEGRRGRLGQPLECTECTECDDPAELGDEAGDPACWAHQVCSECGAVVGDASHLPGCTNAS